VSLSLSLSLSLLLLLCPFSIPNEDFYSLNSLNPSSCL
jgi:hypothetical protein